MPSFKKVSHPEGPVGPHGATNEAQQHQQGQMLLPSQNASAEASIKTFNW